MNFNVKTEKQISISDEIAKCLTYRNISDRCKYLTEILGSVSELEASDILPRVICEIFNHSSDWKLRSNRITRTEDSSLHELLNPTGTLMTCLLKLEICGQTAWKIGLLKLPEDIVASMANALTESSSDDFYASHTHLKAAMCTADFSLSPVAFLCAAMFGYVVHPANKKNDFWFDGSHWFMKIFNRYLTFFIPPNARIEGGNSENQNTLPNFVSHLSLATNPSNHFNRLRVSDSEISMSLSKTFISLFVSTLLYESTAEMHPLNRPSLDHVRLVRSVIRYTHSYVTEHPKSNRREASSHLPFGSPNTSRTHLDYLYEDFYSSLIRDVMPVRLMAFLSETVRNWPNEFPFRVIVECWLDYIQPWRLASSCSQSLDEDIDIFEWYNFIDENLSFYTQMLIHVFPHLLRSDLSMSQNSSVIYRIGKVFSKSDCALMSIVRDCERKMLGLQTLNKSMITSYLPLFTSYYEDDAMLLITNCLKSAHTLKDKTSNNENSDQSNFWSSIWKPLAGDENVFDHSLRQPLRLSGGGAGSGDRMPVIRQLEEAARYWSAMFEIDFRTVCSSVAANYSEKGTKDRSAFGGDENGNYPEHKMGEMGPELTSKGRWQIMTGKRRFNLTYAGDPDLQPVRSFEVSFLVKLALYFSNQLNSKYMEQIATLHERDDVLGRFLKSTFICGPLRFSPHKMAPVKCIDSKTNEFTFKPHVSLRAIASYTTLFYGTMFVCLCFLLLPNWLILLIVFSVILIPVLLMSRN